MRLRGLSLLLAFLLIFERLCLAGSMAFVGDWKAANISFRPISLRKVKVEGFLGKHIYLNNYISIPAGLKTPIPKAFDAISEGKEIPKECRRLAADSDFYKWLEGACYAWAYDPNFSSLKNEIDRYVEKVINLQRPDGYLSTGISPREAFDKKVWHDLYVAGHFFEAAVAHFKATGSKKLLNAACRLADFYLNAFRSGHEYFRFVGKREHPEIELALVRLYRATGKREYLEFAGKIAQMYRIGENVSSVEAGGGRLHAVRFCYLMTGLAELYIETGQKEFLRFLPQLWNELTTTRMYLTGGIGQKEKIPLLPYDLPQTIEENKYRDIAETCASIALMFFSWRMHAITGESKYFDVIERVLYNQLLGALSKDHLAIFYYNPLKRVGCLKGVTDHGGNPVCRTRLPQIHSTACCFPNAWRFLAQLPEYIFSVGEGCLAVNLYTESEAQCDFEDGVKLRIRVKTSYPKNGRVALSLKLSRPKSFSLLLRVPWWCKEAQAVLPDGSQIKGRAGCYLRLSGLWKDGETVFLDLPMKAEAVMSRPEIKANRGRVAFRYGPLVYCLERQDAQGLDLERIQVVINRKDPSNTAELIPCGIEDLPALKVKAGERNTLVYPESPYFPMPSLLPSGVREVTLIPFFLRANRERDTRWITWIPYR